MVVEIMIYYSFIYIALSCLILSKLSINVIKLRRQNKVSFGDDGDRTLMRRIRAQANFIEYTPIFLLSLIFHQSIILLIWSTRSGIKKDYQC